MPGAATAEFHTRFKELYGPHYPAAKATDAKFALDRSKPDPLGLVAQKKASITVPAGCAVAVVAPRRAEEPPRRPHPIWHVPWLHGGGIAPRLPSQG